MAGVAEEAGFRGYMQAGVARAWEQPAAFIVVALAFAALHAANREFVFLLPLYFATSLALSALVTMTGSVWPGVVAHALTDFASFLLLLRFGADALKTPLALTAPDRDAIIVAGAGLASLVIALIAYGRLAGALRHGHAAS